ncbi:hypothetical protein HDR61_01630 [bacterium]|nr:hypothetical protein [bacterium]
MSKKSNDKTEVFSLKWIQQYYLTLIGILILVAVWFNLGYFRFINVQYIEFLTVGDYYAGTMPGMFLELAYLIGFLFPFIPINNDNIIVAAVKDFKNTTRRLIDIIRVLPKFIEACYKTYKISSHTKKLFGSGKCCRGMKGLLKKQEKLSTAILKVKCAIKKGVMNALLNYLLIVFVMLLVLALLVSAIIIERMTCGFWTTVIFVAMFFAFLLFDSFVPNISVKNISKCLWVIIFIFMAGFSKSRGDINTSNTLVCKADTCYMLVRKVEKGCFVKIDNNIEYLDNSFCEITKRVPVGTKEQM